MLSINFAAIIVSAVTSFFVGGIWYSKKVFGGIWSKYAVTVQGEKAKHKTMVFLVAFILYLASAWIFALLLGTTYTFASALSLGLTIGLFVVAGSFGINYLFAGRHVMLLLIDGGYHVVQFALYGVVFGLWH